MSREYRLLPWISDAHLGTVDGKLNTYLWQNPSPGLIELLPNNIYRIDWVSLALNPNPTAIEFIEQHIIDIPASILDELCINLSNNKSFAAIALLTKLIESSFTSQITVESIKFTTLSRNSFAGKLIEKYPERVHWPSLSHNSSPEAVKMLLDNIDKIDWTNASTNEASEIIELVIEQYYHHIDNCGTNINIKGLSDNNNPMAVAFLEAHPDEICWFRLCTNQSSAAMELLIQLCAVEQKNIKKIVWGMLEMNPHPIAIQLIFQNLTHGYWALSANSNPVAMELLSVAPILTNSPFDCRATCVAPNYLASNPAIFETCHGLNYADAHLFENSETIAKCSIYTA